VSDLHPSSEPPVEGARTVQDVQVYEVHVSEQHWAEGFDYSIAVLESQCCPVFRAMSEAGVAVDRVWRDGWLPKAPAPLVSLPPDVRAAIRQFDLAKASGCGELPGAITFFVELPQ
jgi:hypothetical protein